MTYAWLRYLWRVLYVQESSKKKGLNLSFVPTFSSPVFAAISPASYTHVRYRVASYTHVRYRIASHAHVRYRKCR